MTTANSGPSNLLAMKLQSQAREDEDKTRLRRKKGTIVLITQFLSDSGYYDAAGALERESGVTQARHQPADNMTLTQVVQEYEQYYDTRFGHRPKLFRTTTAAPTTQHNAPGGEAEKEKRGPGLLRSNSAFTKQDMKRKDRPRASLTPPATDDAKDAKEKGKENGPLDLCPSAAAIKPERREKATEHDDNDNDNEGEGSALFAARQRLMRPLLSEWTGELRELAQVIQRDILETAPSVQWSDVAALDDAKQLLKEAVVMPMKYPQFFTGRLRPWKGILLFGPPGTGKTMLAKAVATECNTTFFNISASSIVSKWRGDSEKLVRMLFDMARHFAPSTIFLDELDSIMSQRTSSGQEHEGSRRMKTELMIQMDGLVRDTTPGAQVFVLGASNTPWDLDDAILRRLEKRILVGMPTAAARALMFKSTLEGHIDETAVDFTALVESTDGYTGSDINVICREAMMRTVRAKMRKLDECAEAPERLQKELVALDKVTTSDLMHALNVTKVCFSYHSHFFA